MGRPKRPIEDPAIDANEANALFAAGTEAAEDQQEEDQQGEDQQEEFEISVEDKVKLKSNAELNFESNGKSKHMPEGAVYTTSSDQIRLLLKKGYGKIVD